MTERNAFATALDKLAQQFPAYQGLLQPLVELVKEGKDEAIQTVLQAIDQKS